MTLTELRSWSDELLDTVYQHETNRYAFEYVRDIWPQNDALDQHHDFPWLLAYMYSQSQAMYVRRMIDRDGRTRSLFNLLTQLASAAAVVTVDAVVEMNLSDPDGTDPEPSGRLRKALTERAAEAIGGDTLDACQVLLDREHMVNATKHVGAWATKFVAHFDRKSDKLADTSFADLHAATNHIFDVVMKYRRTLGLAPSTIPVPQFQSNWHAPFKVSWLRDGERGPDPRSLSEATAEDDPSEPKGGS